MCSPAVKHDQALHLLPEKSSRIAGVPQDKSLHHSESIAKNMLKSFLKRMF